MKCPICDIEMKISDREGVEIDYCPQCRGVWLDRGELEKIIALIEAQFSPQDREYARERHEEGKRESYTSRDKRDGKVNNNDQFNRDEQNERGGQKREGFFSNLLEIFGGD